MILFQLTGLTWGDLPSHLDRESRLFHSRTATPASPDFSALLLREMTLDDLDFVATMLADPEVMRYYPRCCTREESEA